MRVAPVYFSAKSATCSGPSKGLYHQVCNAPAAPLGHHVLACRAEPAILAQDTAIGHVIALLPPTYCFALANIDRTRLGSAKAITEAMAHGKAEGKLRNLEDHRGEKDIFGSDLMTFNYNHVYNVDCLAPDSLSDGFREGREIAFEFLDYLRQTVPGCENARMANLATLIGVRETRRIKGRFRLTAQAYFQSHRHQDDIAVYDYALDLNARQPTAKSREEYYNL